MSKVNINESKKLIFSVAKKLLITFAATVGDMSAANAAGLGFGMMVPWDATMK